MIRKCVSFILQARVENVIAVAVSLTLLILFLGTHLFRAFVFGPLDFMFILLPAGVLGVKCLLSLLLKSESDVADGVSVGAYLGSFFKPMVNIFRDWFPFFLLSACYFSLFNNLNLQVNPHTVDHLLSRADAWLLGNQAAFLLQHSINPWLTEYLNVIYFSHLLFFPGVALYFYLKRDLLDFRRLMLGYLTLFLMGICSYILLPAVGPEKYFADQFVVDLKGKALSHGVDYIIGAARVSHDCFPSLHVGIPLLITLYLRDYCRKAFLPAAFYVANVCCATIYLRYHYVVDVIAAFAFAPAAYWLNDLIIRHWPGEQALSESLRLKRSATITNQEPASNV